MQAIRKEYPGVLALNDVSFDLRSGEVHCLLGENGAGKSTLMKILAGALQKDAGEILMDGVPVDITTPSDAQRHGIAMIYQDLNLVAGLSVAENIVLGREPRMKFGLFIDVEASESIADDTLNQLGETLNLKASVSSLSHAQRQIVEIAKAISRQNRILVLDEPSAALTVQELHNLFRVLERLKSDGVGIIYISHRLEEIFAIGDRLTVLRDGVHIRTCPVAETDRQSIIRWMVGRDMEQEYPRFNLERGPEILGLENVSGGIVQNVNLSLSRGEIFGLAGLVGSGRTELAHLIFGEASREEGKVFLDGAEINPRSPREAINLGIGLLTEDRNAYGVLMQMGIRENVTLSNLRSLLRGPFIDKQKERSVTMHYVDELRIKTPDIDQPVEHLSGGNRQKVVLARWLCTKSKVLIFDEPTAGIDVGVRYEIYTLMGELANQGMGILVISSDFPELLGICDRIAVMCRGRVNGILSRHEATQEKIMALATEIVEDPLAA